MNKICRPKSSYCEELRLIIKKSKRNKNNFNPNREYINSAIKEFLGNGGRITKLESYKENNEYNAYSKGGD